MERELEKKSLPELKGLCSTYGVSKRGNKETIVRSLVNFLTSDGNESHWPEVFSQNFINLMRNSRDVSISCCALPKGGEVIKCTNCAKFQHLCCIAMNSKISPYLCPECILVKISPLEVPTDILVSPWIVRQCPCSGSTYEVIEKNFKVPLNIRSKILMGSGELQVQVRCIKMDGSSLKMCWPAKGLLLINNKIAMRLETSANPNAKKRKDEPLNITEILPDESNTISLISINDQSFYFVSVFVIKKKLEDRFIEEVIRNNTLSIEKSKEFIKNNLRLGDSELLPSSIRLNLRCPLTMGLIDIPVRGANCKHIQCFNLDPYIRMQKTSKVNRWCCPECKEYVYDLIFDLYLKEIFDNARKVSHSSAVEIFPDSSFRIIVEDDNSNEDESLPRKRMNEESAQVVKMPKKDDYDIIEID